LGRLKNSGAIPALIDAMGDRLVADSAERALVDLGPIAILPLVQVLSGESTERADHAIAALVKIGGEEAIDALVRVLETGTTSLRRTAAIEVKNLHDPRIVRALFRSSSAATLPAVDSGKRVRAGRMATLPGRSGVPRAGGAERHG
jgi:HEAT repeat protein